MGGKKYYIHLYYEQNSSSDKSMKINKITYSLSGQDLIYDSLDSYNDKFYLSTEEESRIIFEPEVYDNKLGVSAKKYNTTSGGYQEIDLTDKEGTYLLTVNAKSNVGRGTIYVSESSIPPQVPATNPYISFEYYTRYYCNYSNVRCIYSSTADNNFNFRLDGGKKYYVHFINDNGSSSYVSGQHNFIINSIELIKLGDEISNISMEDITSDSCSDDLLNYSSCLKKSSTYDYGFLYDNGSIISSNKEISNSCSHSYIELDLSSNDSSEYVIVSFNSLISSESNYDFGNIIITESSSIPSLYSRVCDIRTGDDCVLISSGSSADDSYVKLKGGKKYYVHFTYCKDSSKDSGNDYFSINKMNLYKGIDNISYGFDEIVNYRDYTFKEQENGTLISTNKGVGNTKSHRYVKIDLSSYGSDERFLLEIDNFLSAKDYGYIYLSSSERMGYNWTSLWSRGYSNFTNSEILSKILNGGQVYYIHFVYNKDSSGDGYEDFYRIDGIRIKHYVSSDLKSIDLSKDKYEVVNYNYVKDGDKYVSNNNNTYSAAYSYFELDLSEYSTSSTINLIVNATLDNSSYRDYIRVTSSTSIPLFPNSCNSSNKCKSISKGTYDYTVSLTGGEKYYVHLLNSNNDKIANMIINSIRIEEKLLDEVKYYCYYNASVDNINTVFSQLSNKVTESVPKLAAKSADIILTTKFNEDVAFHIEDSNGNLVDTIIKKIDLSSSEITDGTYQIKFQDEYRFVLDESVNCDEEICTLNLRLFDINLKLYYDNDKVSTINLDEEMVPVVSINFENGKAVN